LSVRKLEEAENTLRKWKRAADLAPEAAGQLPAEVVAALCDDLATYAAFQMLTQLAGEATEGNDGAASLKAALSFLGFDVGAAKVDEDAIASTIADRLALIAAKNWPEADRIRDELLAQGVQLKDGKDPATGERITTWEVKR
jgi:cysteinyl-tRNA synthetase